MNGYSFQSQQLLLSSSSSFPFQTQSTTDGANQLNLSRSGKDDKSPRVLLFLPLQEEEEGVFHPDERSRKVVETPRHRKDHLPSWTRGTHGRCPQKGNKRQKRRSACHFAEEKDEQTKIWGVSASLRQADPSYFLHLQPPISPTDPFTSTILIEIIVNISPSKAIPGRNIHRLYLQHRNLSHNATRYNLPVIQYLHLLTVWWNIVAWFAFLFDLDEASIIGVAIVRSIITTPTSPLLVCREGGGGSVEGCRYVE